MTFTNEERREVAENLRSMVDYDCRYKEQFYELLTETVMNDWEFHSFRDTAERLADLIDRPTCHLEWNDLMGCWECSNCGETWGNSYDEDDNKPYFKYCSKCGADVIE